MLNLGINTFKGRGILFGIISLIAIVLSGLLCSAAEVASGSFIVYGILVALVLGILYEPISAKIEDRRMSISVLIGGSTFGSILAGVIVTVFCLLTKIVV